ncbi:hypothetical protein B0H14DRAFT_2718495, partial [Mycena olivaceomarginata]
MTAVVLSVFPHAPFGGSSHTLVFVLFPHLWPFPSPALKLKSFHIHQHILGPTTAGAAEVFSLFVLVSFIIAAQLFFGLG